MLISTNSRHRYFAVALAKRFEVAAVISGKERNYYTAQKEQSDLARNHFGCRKEAGQIVFEPNRHEQCGRVA